MKKNFYAVQSIWGADKKQILTFTSRKERDEYVNKTDYSNAVTVKQLENHTY